VGRTGRAEASGRAISFIDHDSAQHFRTIEKQAGIRLTRQSIPGFELTGEAPKKVKGPQPVKGKRKSKKDKLREAQAPKISETQAPEIPETQAPEVPETQAPEQSGWVFSDKPAAD
jgi:superfamily II DNA/RNA helicase